MAPNFGLRNSFHHTKACTAAWTASNTGMLEIELAHLQLKLVEARLQSATAWGSKVPFCDRLNLASKPSKLLQDHLGQHARGATASACTTPGIYPRCPSWTCCSRRLRSSGGTQLICCHSSGLLATFGAKLVGKLFPARGTPISCWKAAWACLKQRRIHQLAKHATKHDKGGLQAALSPSTQYQ